MPTPAEPNAELSFDELRAVLTVTLRAGALLLEHGADTHRVEETIARMGKALGAASMDVYVTPTGIIASTTNGWEHRTNIRRTRGGSVDLARIDAINRLSRRVEAERLDHAAVAEELERIARLPRLYSQTATFVTVGLACGCFSQLFGGSWQEFVVAALAGSLALYVRQSLVRRGVGPLLQITPAAFMATIAAVWLGWFLEITSYDALVPASILPLIPGVPLINALSDLLASDFAAGVARAAQALLITVEIAVGVAVALDMTRAIGLGG